MQIASDRAFWILDFYRRHGTRLHLAGTISDEHAAAFITITDVSATLNSINVRLFEDEGSEWWDRHMQLRNARYFFSQMGDPSFASEPVTGCHSVLQMEFPDGASLYFTERSASGHLSTAAS
jgi:hypothetical protein